MIVYQPFFYPEVFCLFSGLEGISGGILETVFRVYEITENTDVYCSWGISMDGDWLESFGWCGSFREYGFGKLRQFLDVED